MSQREGRMLAVLAGLAAGLNAHIPVPLVGPIAWSGSPTGSSPGPGVPLGYTGHRLLRRRRAARRAAPT